MAAPYAEMVIDARTGEVLASSNADTRLHPASLTKMMTLYIAFEAIQRGEISLDTKVKISRNAAAEPPSKMGLKAGQSIALRYLIRAAAVKSANDAATAIGEAIEGSEAAFARRMNRTAKALGMSRSTFRNANGLTEQGHLSTARDMTTLGRRLFYDYPQFYNIFSRRTADVGKTQISSTNRRFLDSYEGADGIKTGYTVAAGYNLVGSAQRGNKRIIATVFGGKSTASRNSRVAELLDLGFGKAPQAAPVELPDPPLYADSGAAVDEAVGEALAAVTGGGNAQATAKTIRVVMAPSSSPRPRTRPGTDTAPPADEMLMAMADDIRSAVTEANTAAAAPASGAPDPAPAIETAEDRAVAALRKDISTLLAALETTPPSQGPLPETMALRPQSRPDRAAGAPADAGAGSLVAAADEAPAGAPADQTAIEIAAAVPAAAPSPKVSGTASPDLARPEPAPADAGVATASPAATGAPAPDEAAQQMLAFAALPRETFAPQEMPATRPLPRPAGLSETAGFVDVGGIADALAEADALPEVVTRMSTSGGRTAGISIGSFNSSYDAERALLQTALSETGVLSEALRKVVPGPRGFDATFVGMTDDMAAIACRRLMARAQECAPL